jgi:hypothetical protein
MGLMDIINKQKAEATPQPTEQVVDPNQLTLGELEYLLNSLKTVQLRGDQVEQFYTLVIKLQNQYIVLSKK